ncbi:type 1 glutamine amidotransferase [Methanobrevibacter filiformis]|nr:glutamine amidotransferase [Methanobrevibacter filiformis]
MELNIVNMYPDILNLYGDLGNLIAIKQRCLWRNIKVNVENFTIDNETNLNEADIIVIGGGADTGQNIVSKHLTQHQKVLSEHVEDNKFLLAICGSYQMFGTTYIDANKNKIPCLEIFDIETISEENRLIGNIIIESNLELKNKNIIGFENHGGRTYHDYKSLGRVKLGNGNNGKDKTEGMIYKNFIGSYLHGPLLPKNPELTDHIILNTLKKKYSVDSLSPLNNNIENNAHNAIERQIYINK